MAYFLVCCLSFNLLVFARAVLPLWLHGQQYFHVVYACAQQMLVLGLGLAVGACG